MIICETIKMMESIQAAVDEMANEKREEFIESQEEQEIYELAGHELTREELMSYIETVVNMQQTSDLRLPGSMMRVKKKLNKG